MQLWEQMFEVIQTPLCTHALDGACDVCHVTTSLITTFLHSAVPWTMSSLDHEKYIYFYMCTETFEPPCNLMDMSNSVRMLYTTSVLSHVLS